MRTWITCPATCGSSRRGGGDGGDDRRRPGVGRVSVTVPALSGRGVTVAVIDSGIDTRHNALARRVIATQRLHRRRRHATCSATARTWRRSSPGAPAGPPTRASYRGIASGAYLINLRVLGDDGSGDGERRDRGDRLGDRAPQPIQHRGHQPVARRAGAAAVSRRSDVRGGGARGPQGVVVVVAAGNYGRTPDGEVGVRGDHVAGEQPVCADGGGDRHARDAAAVATTRWRRTARRGRRGTTW